MTTPAIIHSPVISYLSHSVFGTVGLSFSLPQFSPRSLPFQAIFPISVSLYSHVLECVCGRSFAGIVGSNPTGDMDVCNECCVLLARGLCVGLITRPEESY